MSYYKFGNTTLIKIIKKGWTFIKLQNKKTTGATIYSNFLKKKKNTRPNTKVYRKSNLLFLKTQVIV